MHNLHDLFAVTVTKDYVVIGKEVLGDSYFGRLQSGLITCIITVPYGTVEILYWEG